MQKQSKLAMLFVIVFVATMFTSYAYADNNSDSAIAGLNAGAVLKTGGLGALSGALLSIFTVWNKNQTAPGTEKIDPKKLGINILLGGIIGVALTSIGVDVNDAKTTQVFAVIIPLATNYFFLHFFNLSLRPMFGNWIKGKDAKSSEPKTG